ncbi:probable beta-galactosidase A [Aspergillus lentulus]|nr:probable beta-galactosidase A [Aspergillus lentulus]
MLVPQYSLRAAIVLTFAVQCVRANVNDQFSSEIDTGTFQNPSALLRPRFRYWLPDSSVDEQVVRDDIKSAAAIGAGGVEFLAFYNAGGVLGGAPPGDDWSKYGFGTPAFTRLFQAALEAHRDAGMVMDFAIGPNQGQGVPAEPNDEGLQWDLVRAKDCLRVVPSSQPVPANGSFDGVIPGWGTGDLLALVSAEVVSSKRTENPTLTSTTRTPYTRLVLKESSLASRTSQVSAGGHLSLTFPASTHNHSYWLFAFYERLSHAKNLELSSNLSSTVFDNGSYNVDHFSARGAETVIKFWEKYILNKYVKSLLTQVGNYAWEDSVEIKSNISWTRSLPSVFEQMHGYSLINYLPLIMFGNNNIAIQASEPGAIQCVLDTPDEGAGYVNDYRGALVEGYRQYLKTLTEWVNSVLNLQMSAQVSYNLPMEMEANVPLVNAPECESLGFMDNIDGYRQFSGPAVLAGKRVVSNEIGAVSMKAFQYQISSLLWSINRAVVGGVNQFVIHGQSYTGNYWSTTWPGYTAFSYFYSEMWSNKQPAWDHGLSDVLGYVGRLQYSQQAGPLKTDIAIYNKQSATDFTFQSHPANLTDLIDAGYSYSYLSPDNFDLPQAYVRNGTLAPDGPAYKALVIYTAASVTYDSIDKIRQFAEAGLPVILAGGDPSYYVTADAANKDNFTKGISQLKRTKNVYAASNDEIINKLSSLNLEPRIRVRTNGTWYTTWRESVKEDIQFAFVFNDGMASTGHITVASDKTPHLFDMWTGRSEPILHYRQAQGKTLIPLALESNQTVLIGFVGKSLRRLRAPSFHAIQVPSTILGYEHSTVSSESIELHVAAGSFNKPLVLFNGKNYTSLPGPTPAPSFKLDNWSLTAEHWTAPFNMSDASPIALKYNTTHRLQSLVPWTEIQGLANASGIGYYRTGFEWPPHTGSADGAYILLPRVLHTIRLQINGRQTLPFDYNAPKVDISAYLKNGRNEILVIVPTPMWNYLRSIFDRIVMSGYPPLISITNPGPLPEPVDTGLSGTVQVVPYVKWQATVK